MHFNPCVRPTERIEYSTKLLVVSARCQTRQDRGIRLILRPISTNCEAIPNITSKRNLPTILARKSNIVEYYQFDNIQIGTIRAEDT